MDNLDREILKRLQEDIPMVPQPFSEMSDELGMDEQGFLKQAQRLQSEGIIRRFGAILHHRQSGIGGNAMVVWAVPPDKLDRLGAIFSENPSVTHCYSRTTKPGWKYNLYTMIHAFDPDGCEELARRMADENGIEDYQVLHGIRELKKISMNYFGHLDSSSD